MRRRPVALDLVVFTGVLLLGLARLPEPFFGDQALNLLMGEVIADGGTPYADLWDLKHPGVFFFFFFAAGGAHFGFNEIGIHLFELLWMLALAVIVRSVVRQSVDTPMVASLAPGLTVGTYYACTTGYHVTQTEALVGLPLLLSLVAAVVAVRPRCRRPLVWLFASGLSAGVVFAFKAPYVILPGIFWLLAGMEWRRVNDRSIPVVRKMAPPLLAGMLLPVSAVVIYLALKPGLGLVWWTFVEYPREAANQGVVNSQRFVDGVVWFVRTFRVPLALAIVGAWDRRRRGWDLLTKGLVTWVAAGLLLIWMQVISWWSYHYLLLFVPVGLLAVQGFESLWLTATATATPRRLRAITVAALILLIALYVRQVEPAAGLVAAVFGARPLPFDSESMRMYQAARNQHYADALATTSFLREPGSYAGAIYVFGDPILYHLAGRLPAIPLLTWGTFPPFGTWNRLIAELEKAAPPYILVSDQVQESIIVHHYPTLAKEMSALRSRLEQRYQKFRTDAGGTWYVRLDLARRSSIE
jgi:hypothetical protein